MTEYEASYDECCKALLSNKSILANILKECIDEFKEYDVKYIEEECIEGEPEISSVAVHRNQKKYRKKRKSGRKKTSKITGMNSEDKTIDEGIVFYDIRFYAKVPKSEEIIKLIINVEAQNEYYVGYPLIKRAIYYACRQISAQYGTEFTESQYQDIKKVYSIWVLNKVPKKIQNTITKYKITEENVVGELKEDIRNYDLINIIMICLEDDSDSPDVKGILKLLRVLLSDCINADRKTEMLENEFYIEMNEKIEQELMNMCNLSSGILERGIEIGETRGEKRGKEQGILESILNLKESLNYNDKQAMDILKIPVSEQKKYLKLLNDKDK